MEPGWHLENPQSQQLLKEAGTCCPGWHMRPCRPEPLLEPETVAFRIKYYSVKIVVTEISTPVVRLGSFTAATMKNSVFWDLNSQLVPHRKHSTSPLQSPAG
jgi:hypothetical protein